MYKLIFILPLLLTFDKLHAYNADYERLAVSTQTSLLLETSDQAVSYIEYAAVTDNVAWLIQMSRRLEKYIPNVIEREEFLRTVYYEATRADLDPQLVLSVIQVESSFKKYAISQAGARGYMQIMPFWVNVIGHQDHNLFHLRVNLRYGCTILKHYLDIEKGNYARALARYNGSLGKTTYPNLVFAKMANHWRYSAFEFSS